MARKSKSKDEQLILSNYKKEEEKLLAKNKKTKEYIASYILLMQLT